MTFIFTTAAACCFCVVVSEYVKRWSGDARLQHLDFATSDGLLQKSRTITNYKSCCMLLFLGVFVVVCM